MHTRIIGCGNRDRGDDAAGLLVVDRLRTLGLPAQACTGEVLTLLDMWTAEDDVILIDAVRTGSAPGRIVEWDAIGRPLAAEAFPRSTHSIGLRDAVEFGRHLGRLPRTLRIYGIEAHTFTHGAAPCLAVRDAVDQLAATLSAQP